VHLSTNRSSPTFSVVQDYVYWSSDDDEDAEEGTPSKSNRHFMEVDALTNVFDKHCVYPECKMGQMDISLRTLCLATSIVMKCRNKEGCGYVYYGKPPSEAQVGEAIDARERNTDYAVNVLYVVSFSSCGDGPREAAKVRGFLGLPNATMMESRSFGIIEERLSPVLQKLGEDILLENLVEEVRTFDNGSCRPF
jgi:hypothetical protein